MSPRAACRLETLGFTAVYDYAAGKADWLAAGLPTEGAAVTPLRAGALARADIPTCAPDDSIATARQRVAASDEDRCVVTSAERVVLGVLHQSALAGDHDTPAGDAMAAGPSTVRAHEDLHDLAGRMHAHNVPAILVTDPQGRLLGLLHRDDADAALAQGHDGER
jgi:CBS domain-containing protein